MSLPGGGSMFFVKNDSGATGPSWRLKVLVWVLPVLTIAAGLFWALSSFMWVLNATEAEGTVTKVYEWPSESAGSPTLYGPEFSYTWTDGSTATGALALSSPDFNFEIGSKHTILFDPAVKGNVRFPGFAFTYLGGTIVVAIGLMFALISLVLWVWVKTIARKRDQKEA